jgi:hypothetical protein
MVRRPITSPVSLVRNLARDETAASSFWTSRTSEYGKQVGTSCRQQSRSADSHVVMASGRCSKLQPNRDTHRTPPKILAGMEAVCDDGRASNRELSQRI